MSKIAWTDETWNPVTGCTKLSEGCKHCYAETMAKRLEAMGQPKYADGFQVRTHPEALDEPAGWRKPRRVFVCSMADLFHKDVPFEFINDVFGAMFATGTKHEYQLLTKRPERMLEFAESWLGDWPSNVWAGVTVENNAHVDRVDLLRRIPARVRFISAEPLLGALPDLDLQGIDQLIVGGESGPGWRPMEADWVRGLRDRSLAGGTAFFFKQWAGHHPKKLGHELDGREWRQMPQTARSSGAPVLRGGMRE